MWQINKTFLIQQIKKGKEILLSHDPLKATGAYKKEIDLLIDKGFKFIKKGNIWEALK